MKKNFKNCLLAAMFLAPFVAGAQVTIGSGEKPADFSVLELISNNTRGLRLPQVNNDQRQNIENSFGDKKTNEAMGLQIFNTDTKCVETWNGSVWISSCVMCGDVPCQYLKIKIECAGIGDIPVPQFMAYNLGADPSINTPKDQMKHLIKKSQEANYDYLDASVFGGLYQWGRAGHDYAVSTDGTFRRYAGSSTAAQVMAGATYDTVTGQILTYDGTNSAAGLHIYDTNPYTFRGDWSITQRNDLWGNGSAITTATDAIPGGIPWTDKHTYQSPVKTVNDPCPDGWRVPTEDEWERLIAYDCNSMASGGSFSTSADNINGTTPSKSPFTWVPVVCSGGVCTAKADWKGGTTGTSGTYSGYAVYKKEDWVAFADKTGDLSADGAPEPFIFLPAAGDRANVAATLISNSVGSSGSYWSSTISGTNARYLSLSSTNVSLNANNTRARGYSIRCVAE